MFPGSSVWKRMSSKLKGSRDCFQAISRNTDASAVWISELRFVWTKRCGGQLLKGLRAVAWHSRWSDSPVPMNGTNYVNWSSRLGLGKANSPTWKTTVRKPRKDPRTGMTIRRNLWWKSVSDLRIFSSFNNTWLMSLCWKKCVRQGPIPGKEGLYNILYQLNMSTD